MTLPTKSDGDELSADEYNVLKNLSNAVGNVKDYGAIGDGSTDDAAALQAAIDDNYGGCLFIPPGLYRFVTGLTITRPIMIVGSLNARGSNATAFTPLEDGVELQYAGTTGTAILVSPSANARIAGVVLRDFALKGNRDVVGVTSGTGIKLLGGTDVTEHIHIERVTVWRFKDDGFDINDHLFSVRIVGCASSENGRHGIVKSGSDSGDVWVTDYTAVGNATTGITVSAGGLYVTNANIFQSATGLSATAGNVLVNHATLEGCQVGLYLGSVGAKMSGLNIIADGLTNAIGIDIPSGGGRSWIQAIFGGMGTTPTHIRMQAGSLRTWFDTDPLPDGLTISIVGSEIFLGNLFTRVEAGGSAHFTTAPHLDAILEETGGAGVTIDGALLKDGGAEFNSTAKAVRVPRMTGGQRDILVGPADGDVIYNTSTNKLQVRAAAAWVDLH